MQILNNPIRKSYLINKSTSMEQINWDTPLKLGEDLTLKNRIIMAALTRERCNPQDNVPH